MSRLLTDVLIAGMVAAVVVGVWQLLPVLLDALFDPYHDRFDDVDRLAREDR